MKVGVVGGGPWGVALALAAARAGSEVVVLSRREQELPPGELTVTDSYARVAEAQLIVVAVPSNVVRDVTRRLGDFLDGSHLVIHGVRGLGDHDLCTLTDVIREETPVRRLGALGGPVQADELRDGRPSAIVCGSHYPEVIAATTAAFQSASLHVYATADLRGLEWASALVGCLSIGIGLAEQSGAGPGLIAALISRAMDEAAQIAVAAGATERTLLGLGGYGDLLASIALEDRPEVVIGRALGRGLGIEQAVAEARLRVEAISLIPRVAAFAHERGVRAGIFDALADALTGADAQKIVERMFAA